MTEDDRTVTVRIPLVFKKHGGRKTVISPDGSAWERPPSLVDSALVRGLARAFRWQRLLDEGTHGTFGELAKAEGVSQSHVSRMLRLTLLAPDLIEAILAGRQPEEMRLEGLLAGIPDEWGRQRECTSTILPTSGFPSKPEPAVCSGKLDRSVVLT
jgi:hypothetical protein